MLGGIVAGFKLLTSGAAAILTPQHAIREAALHASQPYAVFFGLMGLAVGAGVLGAIFQEAILGLSSSNPATIDSPAVALAVWIGAAAFAAALSYFLTRLYLLLVAKVVGWENNVDLKTSSFLITEFTIGWMVLYFFLLFYFDLDEHHGEFSILYFVSTAIGVIVSARIYRAALTSGSIWLALGIAVVQAGAFLMLGAV